MAVLQPGVPLVACTGRMPNAFVHSAKSIQGAHRKCSSRQACSVVADSRQQAASNETGNNQQTSFVRDVRGCRHQ